MFWGAIQDAMFWMHLLRSDSDLIYHHIILRHSALRLFWMSPCHCLTKWKNMRLKPLLDQVKTSLNGRQSTCNMKLNHLLNYGKNYLITEWKYVCIFMNDKEAAESIRTTSESITKLRPLSLCTREETKPIFAVN